MPTLTLKISKQLRAQLAATAKRRLMTQSELVREAIEKSLREQPGPTGYDLIRDIIEGLPKPKGPKTDRSTNPKYLEGLGLTGPEYRAKFGLPEPKLVKVTRARRSR